MALEVRVAGRPTPDFDQAMWHKFVGTEMNISGYRQLHYHTLRRGCRHAIKGKRVREKESTQRSTAAAKEERHLSSCSESNLNQTMLKKNIAQLRLCFVENY